LARARPRPHHPRARRTQAHRRRRRARADLSGRGDLAARRSSTLRRSPPAQSHSRAAKSEHDRIRFNYWSALTEATSVKDGKLRLQVLISELEDRGYESAARCLAEDLDTLVVHLRYPLSRFPGESSCLSLVWAVLDLFFSHASNGATFTDVDRRHLYRIKYHQADPDTLDQGLVCWV
jgi:hypothetical protein